MRLVTELRRCTTLPFETTPVIHCKLFEDNSGAVELANVPKMRPRTKHINTKYHHFRQYIFDKIIEIVQVPTTEQLADLLTKNLGIELFFKFRKLVCGW